MNKPIINGKGHVIGRRLDNIMLNGNGKVVGRYVAGSDRTVDKRGRNFGQGDQLLRLLGRKEKDE